MKVVAILFHVGAHCVSPLEAGQGSLTAYKVECATIVVAPEAETPPSASPAPANAIVTPTKAAPPKKAGKAKKGSCKKRYFWKNGKRRWKCAR